MYVRLKGTQLRTHPWSQELSVRATVDFIRILILQSYRVTHKRGGRSRFLFDELKNDSTPGDLFQLSEGSRAALLIPKLLRDGTDGQSFQLAAFAPTP